MSIVKENREENDILVSKRYKNCSISSSFPPVDCPPKMHKSLPIEKAKLCVLPHGAFPRVDPIGKNLKAILKNSVRVPQKLVRNYTNEVNLVFN